MPKVHVVDRFFDKVMENDSETQIKMFRKVIEYKNHKFDEDRPNDPLVTVTLEDDTVLQYYDNGYDVFTDNKRIVYAPVYDVETCEKEGYSMYEEEDIIGFVNMEYDYTNYLS